MAEGRTPLVIWRITDGKPGHMNQTLGLANALARLTPCERHDLPAPPRGRTLLDLLLHRFPPGAGLPAPDLILGAGHATHLALLAARRARGGRTVLLMRPSLPKAWFDLCLIPEHDGVTGPNCLTTLGVLNAITPGGAHRPERVLILIGGPSAHYRWDGPAIAQSIRGLVAARPEVRFILTDSRRTPAGFLDALADLPDDRVEPHPHAGTPNGWVAAQLAEAGSAWVTEDSVSMVYEALTSGCEVGILPLPRLGASRVSRGIDGLLERGLVHPARDRLTTPVGAAPFDEAARCAREALRRLYPDRPVIIRPTKHDRFTPSLLVKTRQHTEPL